jgi:hypothetical protein
MRAKKVNFRFVLICTVFLQLWLFGRVVYTRGSGQSSCSSGGQRQMSETAVANQCRIAALTSTGFRCGECRYADH